MSGSQANTVQKTEILGLAQINWFFTTSQTLNSWIKQELFRLQMTSSYSRTLQDLCGDMYVPMPKTVPELKLYEKSMFSDVEFQNSYTYKKYSKKKAPSFLNAQCQDRHEFFSVWME